MDTVRWTTGLSAEALGLALPPKNVFIPTDFTLHPVEIPLAPVPPALANPRALVRNGRGEKQCWVDAKTVTKVLAFSRLLLAFQGVSARGLWLVDKFQDNGDLKALSVAPIAPPRTTLGPSSVGAQLLPAPPSMHLGGEGTGAEAGVQPR